MKMPTEEDDDFEEIEEMQKELKKQEDGLPDLPAIVAALEEKLEEFHEMDDYTKLSKRDLAVNIQILFDCLHDLAEYMVIKAYTIDILDKIISRRTTKIFGSDEEIEEKAEREKAEQEELESSKKRSDHFYM
jgi:chromosome segregation ATPase